MEGSVKGPLLKAGTAGRRVEGDLEKRLPKVDLFMSGGGVDVD